MKRLETPERKNKLLEKYQARMERETRAQLGKYALVGFFGALINIVVTTFLCALFNFHHYITIAVFQVDFYVAFFNGVGILIAFLFNFYWNKRWTFKR